MAVIETREYVRDGKTVKRFKATVTITGFPRTSKTFAKKTDADNWALKTEYEYKYQRNFGHAQHKDKTLNDAIDRYGQGLKDANPKRYKEVDWVLNWWKDKLGITKLNTLTKDIILQKRDGLKASHVRGDSKRKKLSNARVNRVMAVLSRVLNIAVNEWEWLNKNPLLGIEKLPEPTGRTRFLQDDELNRLLDAAKTSRNKDMYTIIVMAITTGARRGEICSMT